jgi:vacuolar-type H+-ATPase subunit H
VSNGAKDYGAAEELRHPIDELIEELEDIADEGRRWYCRVIPSLWGKTVIDHSALLNLAARLRQRLPQEMAEAITIARQAEQIIQQAEEQRDRIIQNAREQAQIIVSNDELVRQAQEKADQVLKAARTEAEAVRAEAEAWSRGVVERLESHVRRILATLDRAKKSLGGGIPEPVTAERGNEEQQE